VLNLQKHFGQANEDVSQILISADKVVKRGGRIEALEFGEEEAQQGRMAIPAPIARKATAAE
jgi:DNA recombination protein RmuC